MVNIPDRVILCPDYSRDAKRLASGERATTARTRSASGGQKVEFTRRASWKAMMPNLNEAFDFVVVGSGFGGSVSAMRLTEKGYHVLVL